MIFKISILLTSLLLIGVSTASPAPPPQPCNVGKETWGYVEVRPGANMFYWLFCANTTKSAPLLIWLQGGPGASSTGIGNFLEIGPQTLDLKNRTDSWVNDVNVMFVDSPVGTGYSYVNSSKILPTDNKQVSIDLVALLKGFFNKVEGFETTPVYIVGESYGGKMAVGFANTLLKEVEKKKIKCNLAGVVLADSWINPINSVMSWGPYLYTLSMIDTEDLADVNAIAAKTQEAINKHQMANATILFQQTQELIMNVTNNVNFYNVLKNSGDDLLHHPKKGKTDTMNKLEKLMNGVIKQKLNIPENVTWSAQSDLVFEGLSNDFMVPAVEQVELLLNKTKIPVVVYNGQLDLICSTPSIEKWASEMHWAGTKSWIKSKRIPEQINSTVWFEKSYKNFSFYWILRAGHMVPIDQLHVSRRLIQKIIGLKKSEEPQKAL